MNRARAIRAALVVGALMSLGLLAVLVTLGTGPLPVSPGGVVSAAIGRSEASTSFAVMDIGLPRGVLALLVGAALGVAGSLVQALTRNPLGSPDVIGFEAGAATAAVFAMLWMHTQGWATTGISVMGGLATAALVFWLSRGGGDMPAQLVLIGIGTAAALSGINSYLLTRADVTESLQAAKWLVGSLNAAGWPQVRLAAIALLVLLPLAMLSARALRAYALGPELAAGLGVPLRRLSVAVLCLAVGCSAVAVSVAGPISFVALATPHLVRPLLRTPGPHVLPCAAGGAFLLALSDMLAQRIVLDSSLPVGLVTGALGGVFLVWLLAGRWRKENV
ncbi:FecCD family ABC transporter permease [Dermacoccaceae bacterium W4C1]